MPSTRKPGSGRAAVLVGLALVGFAYRDVILGPGGPPRLDAWLATGASTPPALVLALATLLVVLRRRDLCTTTGRPAPRRAALLLGAALALFGWGHIVAAEDLQLLSLGPLALAAACLVRGTRAARTLVLPLCLLAFAIPLPGVLANQIVFALQLWTTALAAWLLEAVGIPAVAEGELLVLAGRAVGVIESCSGLGPIKVLTLLAVAYVALVRRPPLHASLLVLAAPPIAFITNAVRVAIVGWRTDAPLVAAHALQGVLLFLVGTALVLLLDRFLEHALPRRPQLPREAATDRAPELRRCGRLLLAAALAALALASLAPRWGGPEARAPWSVQLPDGIDGWQRRSSLPDFDYLGTVRFAWSGQWVYERDGAEVVTVFVGFDDLAHRERSILSRKNALPGRGWSVREQGVVEGLAPSGPPVHSTLARAYGQDSLSYHAYFETAGTASELLRAALALDHSPLRRRSGVRFLRLSTPLAPREDALADADTRLRHLFGRLAPLVFGPPGSRP